MCLSTLKLPRPVNGQVAAIFTLSPGWPLASAAYIKVLLQFTPVQKQGLSQFSD
jgi:hypothetical protein